ncbi:MAG: helix-turn-helix domain-containing protein [Rhodoplanes sp.]|uniref:helix-turn-helix domain-containing protein n=1 Tax=Rhodoplanes sp. TaxID=1968906 RepID=UPI00184C27FE|nr:helix-turn-helix domain-containing protein [Rhodoplanes sp.]NVO13831.1 helix-turn-helix domain-containing protein [Rhodoplanes sp.]
MTELSAALYASAHSYIDPRGFTRTEAPIVATLAKELSATKQQLHAAMYRSRIDADDLPDPKIVDVMVCKIRKKLPEGCTITTVWGWGYEVTPESAAILRTLIAQPRPVAGNPNTGAPTCE